MDEEKKVFDGNKLRKTVVLITTLEYQKKISLETFSSQ